jgi:hypothetical protein
VRSAVIALAALLGVGCGLLRREEKPAPAIEVLVPVSPTEAVVLRDLGEGRAPLLSVETPGFPPRWQVPALSADAARRYVDGTDDGLALNYFELAATRDLAIVAHRGPGSLSMVQFDAVRLVDGATMWSSERWMPTPRTWLHGWPLLTDAEAAIVLYNSDSGAVMESLSLADGSTAWIVGVGDPIDSFHARRPHGKSEILWRLEPERILLWPRSHPITSVDRRTRGVVSVQPPPGRNCDAGDLAFVIGYPTQDRVYSVIDLVSLDVVFTDGPLSRAYPIAATSRRCALVGDTLVWLVESSTDREILGYRYDDPTAWWRVRLEGSFTRYSFEGMPAARFVAVVAADVIEGRRVHRLQVIDVERGQMASNRPLSSFSWRKAHHLVAGDSALVNTGPRLVRVDGRSGDVAAVKLANGEEIRDVHVHGGRLFIVPESARDFAILDAATLVKLDPGPLGVVAVPESEM